MTHANPFRARLPLLGILLLAILANVGVLLSYNAFYDSRVLALMETRDGLLKRRDEARAAAEKVVSAEKRLVALRDGLASFHDDLLGLRRERLAPLIEDVYTITKKAGVRPDTVSYGEDGQEGGIQRLGLTFSVNASYPVVKGVLAAFEKNPQFLILDGVSVTANEEQPDLLNVNLSVIHYFRDERMNPALRRTVSRAPRPARSSASSTSARKPAARTTGAPQ
ncbi:MAG: hypothetical protein JNK60_22000 [Acidobacteria bacterium]|nr:hypothetical protein [Acidobacteriota bacterium]